MNGMRRQGMFRSIITTLFLVTFLFTIAISQENNQTVYANGPYSPRASYGLFFDLNYNMHSANFSGKDIQGIPDCCPRYETGQGIGYGMGLFYAFSVMKDWDLDLRFAYSNLSAVLSKDEPVYLDKGDGTGMWGNFKHTVDASITSIGLMPLLRYKTTNEISLYVGARAGMLMSPTFSTKEEITKPDIGVFFDTKTRTRHVQNNIDIPNASTLDFAGMVGISYSLPMGSSYEWFLEPEVFYTLGLMPIASNLSWTANALSGGVAIRYSPREVIPPITPPKEAPLPPMPAPPKPPKFNAFITAVSVDENGKEQHVSKIRVEEYLSRKIHPLLNYVFFDDNSAKIPSRYKKMTAEEKAKFSPNFLANWKTMDVYHEVLNIVGNRMKRYPNTILDLIGCNSNTGAEKGNLTLSKKRAENVKNFLVAEWSISPDRITVQAKNLPDVPSNPTKPTGIEENRRVELKSKFNEILFKPITVRDTIRQTNPPNLRFKPRVKSEVGIKSWKVITYQGDNILKVFKGKGMPPKELNLNLKDNPSYTPTLNKDYKYKLIVVDNDNQTWESETKRLKVESYTIQNKYLAMINGEKVDARDFDQFSLISFGFNKSDITPEHKPILKLAKQRIQANSKVDVEGRTDNTGDQALNRRLSKARADATADALGINKRNAKGLGADNPFYSNKLPEGRFYNRTVYISIETKIEMGGF